MPSTNSLMARMTSANIICREGIAGFSTSNTPSMTDQSIFPPRKANSSRTHHMQSKYKNLNPHVFISISIIPIAKSLGKSAVVFYPCEYSILLNQVTTEQRVRWCLYYHNTYRKAHFSRCGSSNVRIESDKDRRRRNSW